MKLSFSIHSQDFVYTNANIVHIPAKMFQMNFVREPSPSQMHVVTDNLFVIEFLIGNERFIRLSLGHFIHLRQLFCSLESFIMWWIAFITSHLPRSLSLSSLSTSDFLFILLLYSFRYVRVFLYPLGSMPPFFVS